MSPEAKSQLDIILGSIDKKYGKGTCMHLNDKCVITPEDVIPTGSIQLDLALGIGGYRKGRIVELFGGESAGKSTLAHHACVGCQKQGREAAYLDVEHCLTGDTLIYNNDTKRYESVLELLEKKEFSVVSTDNKKEIIFNRAHIKPAAIKKIYKLKAERGRIIKVSKDHKILTNSGYKKIQDISPGEYVYTVGEITEIDNRKDITKEERDKYRLLGLFIGDGCRKKTEISGIDEEIINDFTRISKEVFNCKTKREQTNIRSSDIDNNRYHFNLEILKNLFIDMGLTVSEIAEAYDCQKETIRNALTYYNVVDKNFDFRKHASSLRNKKRNKIILEKQLLPTRKNKLFEFLNNFECFNKYSKERRLPTNLTIEQLKEVLAGIFLSDGSSVDIKRQKRCTGSFSTSSRNLALDLQASLQRIGITSQLNITHKKKNDKENYDPTYIVVFSGKEQLLKFLDNVPIYGDKRRKLEEAAKTIGVCNRIYRDNKLVKLLVKSIEELPIEEMTYDIFVHNNNFEEQNYLAEGLIVHNSYDPIYSSRIGVDLDRLIISQPDHAEQALDIVDMLSRSGDVGLIVIDSVAALVPQKELEGDMGDQVIGLQARLMSQAMRKLVAQCDKSKCTLLFINQIRYKIGGYGNPEVVSGGAALAFYASQRIQISKGVAADCDEFRNRAKCKVVKNKCAPPKKTAEFDIVFGKGIDREMELFELAISDGILVKAGSWIKHNGESVAQGEEKALEWLNDNPIIKAAIYSEVLSLRGLE